MSLTLNRGEWSEFYAFVKILAQRHVPTADESLTPRPDTAWSVAKIVKHSETHQRVYDLSDPNHMAFHVTDGGLFSDRGTLSYGELAAAADQILDTIKAGKGAAPNPQAEALAERLHYGRMKASSGSKGDICLIMRDSVTGRETPVSFSIKSFLGGDPTLLNASTRTNFRYEVIGFSGEPRSVNDLSGGSKIRDRLAAINDQAGLLIFSDVPDPVFRANLRRVDSLMPQFLSQYLLDFAQGRASRLTDLTTSLLKNPALHMAAGYTVTADDLRFKLKQFLTGAALGMVPSKPWDGYIAADGGYIIITEAGEPVGFRTENINRLGEYLYAHTRLETGSSTRNRFGELYAENGRLFFNLNLSVRFCRP